MLCAFSIACGPLKAVCTSCPHFFKQLLDAQRRIHIIIDNQYPPARLPLGIAFPNKIQVVAEELPAKSEGGRRTRCPETRPGLVAVTFPPCSSTMRLTSVRPIPSPPRNREIELSACSNKLKILDSSSGDMPMPWSRTRISTSSSSWLDGKPNLARLFGVFGRVR